MCAAGEACSASCQCDSLCGNGVWDHQAGELCDPTVPAGSPGHYYNPIGDDIRICQSDCMPCDSCGNGTVTAVLGEECEIDPTADAMDICGDPTSVGPSTRGECRYQCANGWQDGILQETPDEVPCNPATFLCPDGITECHPEFAPCPVPPGETCDPLTSDGSNETICGESTPGVISQGCSLYDPFGSGHYYSSCRCTSVKIIPQGPTLEDRACDLGVTSIDPSMWLAPAQTDQCKFGCVEVYAAQGCRASTPQNPCTCYGITEWQEYFPELVPMGGGTFYRVISTSACMASGEPIPGE